MVVREGSPADPGALCAKLLRDFPANEVKSESRLREQGYGAAFGALCEMSGE